MNTTVKFWQGTNFWLAVILAFGGLFIGFPQNDASNAVTSVFALIAGIGAIREKVKGVDFKAWITSTNTWNYIAAAVTAAIPAIPTELFQRLNDVLTAAISGNWQGIVTGVFSIATILYYLFKKPA